MKRFVLVVAFLVLALLACNLPGRTVVVTATPAPVIPTTQAPTLEPTIEATLPVPTVDSCSGITYAAQVIVSGGVRIRSGPGLCFPQVSGLTLGTRVEVDYITSDRYWYRLRGQDLWFSADPAHTQLVCGSPPLPVLDKPCPPTATPTFTPTPTATSTPTASPTPTATSTPTSTPIPTLFPITLIPLTLLPPCPFCP